MLTQTLAPETLQSIAVPKFKFHVTLLNRRTGDEQSFEISTFTDSFTSVLREIQWRRDERGLRGYELFETIDLNDPF